MLLRRGANDPQIICDDHFDLVFINELKCKVKFICIVVPVK